MRLLTLSFGTLIGAHRIQRGMSQLELAKQLGISPQYVNDIEHGRRTPTSPELMQKASEVLHLDIDVLCFAAGILPPDILDEEPTNTQILAAFKAMREVLNQK